MLLRQHITTPQKRQRRQLKRSFLKTGGGTSRLVILCIPEKYVADRLGDSIKTTEITETIGRVLTTEFIKLGFVGRLIRGKGCDTLLHACSKLRFPFRLTIVGNGPEADNLHSLSEELHISKAIEWVDLLPQTELRKVYNDIDVLVFPSELQESLGLVALEAMACGTPVIASDYAAQSYYIIDEVNGYKFKVGNANDMSNAIARAMNDYYTDKYIDISEEAYKTASGFFVLTQRDRLAEILLK